VREIEERDEIEIAAVVCFLLSTLFATPPVPKYKIFMD
jgi:hypothetical protein